MIQMSKFQYLKLLKSKSDEEDNNFNNTTRGGSTSAIDVLVPDYIIITNNALKPIFQQLADWKTKKNITFANYYNY